MISLNGALTRVTGELVKSCLSKSLLLSVLVLLILAGSAAGREDGTAASQAGESRKIGVLLVSHGSRSVRWRDMLLDVESSVRADVMATEGVGGIRSAFMEYNEPSIATQLRNFDREGYANIILVPLLLTVSSHSFDDIPTIINAKKDAVSAAMLRSEGIELYEPVARVTMTPLLDFPAMLQENVVRRVGVLSQNPATEGVVLVAYGSRTYSEEWEDLLARLGEELRRRIGITKTVHSWCGHIASYESGPTVRAIHEILAEMDRAIVIPVLVAVDEFFQHQIIGGAVEESGVGERVAYTPDAILPDENLNRWVADIVRETAVDLRSEQGARR